MVTSNIKKLLPYNIKDVWHAVTDIKNYHWRSDLNHTEVLNQHQFIEYAVNGTATHFKTIVFKPYHLWEFTLQNKFICGHWRGTFLPSGTSTLIDFTEEITVKKFYLKPFIKFYLYRQQKLFVKDLQNYLYKVSQKEPLYDKQPNLHTKP